MAVPVKAFLLVKNLTFRGMILKEKDAAPNLKQVIFMKVDRQETSAGCTKAFFNAIATVKQASVNQRPFAISVNGVGLKLEGRTGCYDLYHFLHTDNCYAIDSPDDNVVYQLQVLVN